MMMRASTAAAALHAQLRGPDAGFDSVATDSRTLAPRALFVAIKGERFDGHRFVAQAFAQGAAAAMVQDAALPDMQAAESPRPLLLVDDTRMALGRLAANWRAKFSLPLVALTGSNGKTTVKEMLACILRAALGEAPAAGAEHSGVLATAGNLNNDIGMPLTLLRLRARHRYAVIELGMNHTGEISYLSGIARPGVALVTNAGHAHLGELGSLEAIARAKGEIYQGLDSGGIALINADDRFAPLWRSLNAGRSILEFGTAKQAQVSGRYVRRGFSSEIVLSTPLGQTHATLGVPGEHNLSNALAAAAAAVALAAPLDAIAAGLQLFPGVAGRLQRKPGLHGAQLLDDTYNANPDSAEAAIAVLAQAPGKRLLVLGDMGELGAGAPELHARIGTRARAAGIDRLYTLGQLSEQAARAFGAGARHFPRIEDLLAAIEIELAPDLTLLVKGSRFMQMERVVNSFALEQDA